MLLSEKCILSNMLLCLVRFIFLGKVMFGNLNNFFVLVQ